jgi:ADP-ribose pyrophosphatase YjhB (NUDIX family)
VECTLHRLVADVALFAEGKVLLVKYRDVGAYDGQRGWFLPDDFLQPFEHPHDAAKRIVADQAGVPDADLGLANIESFGNDWWHLVFHYRADLPAIPGIDEGENVAEAHWFDLDHLPDSGEMAHHGWATETIEAMRREPG